MNPQLYERLYGLRWIMLVGLVSILIVCGYVLFRGTLFPGGTQIAAQVTETSAQPLASDQVSSLEASLTPTPTHVFLPTLTPMESTPTMGVTTSDLSVTEPTQTPLPTFTPVELTPTPTLTHTESAPVETDDLPPGALAGEQIDVYLGHCGVYLSNAYSGIVVEIMPEDDPATTLDFVQTPCNLEMFDSTGNEISRYGRVLYKYININERQLRMWLDGELAFYVSNGFSLRKCDAYLVSEEDHDRLVCINGDVGVFGLVGNSTE